METEIIDPPSAVTHVRSTYPEQFAAALESDTLTLRLHDDLPPSGVGIFDDRVAIIGYDTGKNTPTRNFERSISKSSSELLR